MPPLPQDPYRTTVPRCYCGGQRGQSGALPAKNGCEISHRDRKKRHYQGVREDMGLTEAIVSKQQRRKYDELHGILPGVPPNRVEFWHSLAPRLRPFGLQGVLV